MRIESEQISSYRYVIGGLIVLISFFIGLSFFAVSPLLPLIIADYDISRTSASLLVGLVVLVQAVLSIPSGILVARGNVKLIYGIGGLLASSTVLAFLAEDFGVLLGLRVLYGVGISLQFPAMGPLVMQWFPRRQRPLWNSMHMGAFSGGMAVSMFVAAPLAEGSGWRLALTFLSIAAVVGSLAWFVLGRSRDMPERVEARFSLREVRETLLSRTTLLVAGADAFAFALYTAVIAWLPTYYNEEMGLSLTHVGFITGTLPFAGLIAVFVGGALAVKFRRRKPLLVIPGVFIGLAAFGSFLPSHLGLIYPSVFVLGFMAWMYLPILLVLPMELPGATPRKVAMTWSMVGTLASFLAFVSPLSVGAIRDAFGTYTPAFALWAGLSYFFLAAVLLLPETGEAASDSDK